MWHGDMFVSRLDQRGMIDEQHPAVIVIEGRPGGLVRRPVGMLDARRMVVIAVFGNEVDVRRRQERCDDGRRHQ